jgi:hypothetical protein
MNVRVGVLYAELALGLEQDEVALGDDLVDGLVDEVLALFGPLRGSGAEAVEAVGRFRVVLVVGLGRDVVGQY